MIFAKNSNSVEGIYSAVLFAVVLQTISYIILLFGIRRTQYTLNIPYETLLFWMITSLIMFGIAFQKKYYIHLTLYLLQFLLVAYILMAKLDLEGEL